MYWGGGWGAPSQPTCRPARDPRPQTSDWHLLSPESGWLICCCLLREPRQAGAADAPGPAPRPGKFDKNPGKGARRGPAGGGDGAISGDPGLGHQVPTEKEGKAAGRATTRDPESRAGGAAAGLRAPRGAAGPAGAPPATCAGACPGRVPSPRLPLPTSRPAPFVPVCCGDSSPGRAIPPAPLSPLGARRARGPARPAARPGARCPDRGARGAAAGRKGMRAAGAAAAGGRCPAAAAGPEGVYLPAVEPVLADIALDHEAVHVVRLPAHTVHRRGRRGRRGPARSRHRHGCRGGSRCCSRGHRRHRSGHL